jgi:hypothetical protein
MPVEALAEVLQERSVRHVLAFRIVRHPSTPDNHDTTTLLCPFRLMCPLTPFRRILVLEVGMRVIK